MLLLRHREINDADDARVIKDAYCVASVAHDRSGLLESSGS
ncbi:MAG TPA: hypothetical protein VE957_18905 [Terriglobales bacterium]|nr:hypothetical protein [Terriglobales bacterium]